MQRISMRFGSRVGGVGPAKKPLVLLVVAALLIGFALSLALTTSEAPAKRAYAGPRSYMVLLDNSVRHPEALAKRQAANRGTHLNAVYRFALKGYAATMTGRQAREIAMDPAVRSVELDRSLETMGEYVPPELQLGVYMAGEKSEKEASQPRFEAESYVAAMKGEGLGRLTTSTGTFECEKRDLRGQISHSTNQVSFGAEYGGCTATSLKFPTTVSMNSCKYTLTVENAGPPYTGALGVACSKEGDGIEFNSFTKAGAPICRAKILPQTGLNGVGLSNAGSGFERGVAVAGEVNSIKYELSGSCSPTAAVLTNGVTTWEGTLLGWGQEQGFDNHDKRIGVDENPNLTFIGDNEVDGAVEADVAVIDTGIDKHADLNVAGRSDCAHPDRVDFPEYTPPSYEDPNWRPDQFLNTLEPGDPFLHPDPETTYQYGCLEGTGFDENPEDGLGHGTGMARDIGELDNNRGGVGYAPGVRLWGLRRPKRGVGHEAEEQFATTLCKTTREHCGFDVEYYPDVTAVSAHSGSALISASGSGGVQVSCSASTLEGQTGPAGVPGPKREFPLPLEVAKWTLTGCKAVSGGSSCTVSAGGAPYAGFLVHTVAGVDGGGLTIGDGGAGDPGWHVECAGASPPIDCIYSFEPELELKGGEPASIVANEKPLSGAGKQCGSGTPKLTATYTVDSPQPLHVGITKRFWEKLSLSHNIAAVDWVAERRHEYNDGAGDGDPGAPISVASMAWGCKVPWNGVGVDPHPIPSCDRADALEVALKGMIAEGVVGVAAGGNSPEKIEYGEAVPVGYPDVLSASAVADFDGEPGGLAAPSICKKSAAGPEGIEEIDDRRAHWSGTGRAQDIASPVPRLSNGCVGGGTSNATASVSGAVALLTSQCLPRSRTGVLAISNTLTAEGTYDWEDIGTVRDEKGLYLGWSGKSPDGWKEPLLNVSDPAVFDPRRVERDAQTGEVIHSEGESDCGWLEKPAATDVDGDRRSDLLTLDAGGSAHVYRGFMEGSSHHSAGGYKMSEGTASLKLDPALLDGKGEYAIGAADVTGDGKADLVSVGSAGGVSVRPGSSDRTFGEAVEAYATQAPVMSGGKHQPIALADVNGDGRADYVYESHTYNLVGIALGQANGAFSTGEATSGSIDPALLDGKGEYFLDAADVTGDGKADLVGMNTSGTTYVRPGQSSGAFAAAVSAATIDPVMDDGKGEEPIGLGDANGDGRADLLTLSDSDGKLKLRLGQSNGAFAAATTPYASTIDSSLLDGSGQELIGLLDYDRDGLADLVAIGSSGEVLTYRAQVSGGTVSFASPINQGGSITTTRSSDQGQELLSEMPLQRRAGCLPSGCKWPAQPIAAYSFNEGSGTTLHDTTTHHEGAIKGATWTSEGKYGSALDFNGTSDLVEIADANDLDLTGSFTLEAWVRPDFLTSIRTVLGKAENPGGVLSGYQLQASFFGKPDGYAANAGALAFLQGPTALAEKAWSHLALTSDGANLRLYLNGELQGTLTAVKAGATAAALLIGKNPVGANYFDGRIDNLRIYDEPLTQSQIQADRDTGV